MAKWTGGTFVLGRDEVVNDNIAASPPIDADKMEHLYKPGTNFALAIGATPVAREELVFIASTAGTVRGFHALLKDTGSSTSVTFDLKKNGTTMLTGVVTITNSELDGAVLDGTLASTSFVADDRLSIALAVSSSTGAQGPYAWIELTETAA